jgi:hypothetical protein
MKFTKGKLDAAIIELLGVQNFSNHVSLLHNKVIHLEAIKGPING